LENERAVSREAGQALASQWNCPFVETSAKIRANVTEVKKTKQSLSSQNKFDFSLGFL
jgi:hypothetical protein